MVKTSKKLCSLCHKIEVYRPHDVISGFVCPQCEAQKAYSTPNKVKKGTVDKLPSFSLEFEIAAAYPSSRRALILLQYQFERTYDSTVSDEYKSPIYQSLRAFRKPLAILDTLRDLVNDSCGTHLHVAFNQQEALYPQRDTIFGPLITHLATFQQQTIAFWGRSFCEQAKATLIDGERHVCFNIWSRHPTIEYRLPRFRNGEQYLAVVQFCRSTTAFLEQCFSPSLGLSSSALPPQQIGEQVLARYQKAWKAYEAVCPSQNVLPL